jgi:PII-like signaling protein
MSILDPARLTIYLCDSARFQHKPLGDVIVRRAQAEGLAGATVLRGIEGFGRGGDIHTTRILDVSDHLPMTVVLIDDEDRLRDFVNHNADCLRGRLISLERIELHRIPETNSLRDVTPFG